MFLIQFTSRNKVSKVPKVLRSSYTKDLVTKYWDVYNNNNDRKLQLFFQDPLVKIMWRYWSEEHLAELLHSIPKKG